MEKMISYFTENKMELAAVLEGKASFAVKMDDYAILTLIREVMDEAEETLRKYWG
ncbi:hypothetical protein [Bacillus kexueae]|uniref:hypothetical protein n=1 Tax=Aeribacillus kexueae TaxID=2078952 RepID=UPI001FAF6639|nr:hypothetical protein [Bacillus kexueae]